MSDFFCFTRTQTGPSGQRSMVWGTHVTLLYRTGEAQRSDRPASALKDPGCQCISKAEITSTSFACIGNYICPWRFLWNSYTPPHFSSSSVQRISSLPGIDYWPEAKVNQ